MSENNRTVRNDMHAYLIMAHHRFDLLKILLTDLDDKRNDIFLHIDKKAGHIDEAEIRSWVHCAQLIFIPRMKINWGGFSQIVCILEMLKIAIKMNYHTYYHFMVGVEFPLKSQDYIHNFFKLHKGKQFIGYDNSSEEYIERICYKHVFNEYGRSKNILGKLMNVFHSFCVKLQKIIGVKYQNVNSNTYKKGNANWSITHELAQYIVSKRTEIYKLYRYSYCADEIFIHTLVYNSRFYEDVYNYEDEYLSSMRLHQWEKGKNNQYHLNDIDMLLQSGRLFARKFDGDDGVETMLAIKRQRRE